MPRFRWVYAPMIVALAAGLFLAAGCKSSPKPGEAPPAAAAPAPPPQPAPTPAPPVPPPRPKSGRIADEEVLKKLAQGKTTKDEVRETFGIPQEVILSPTTETYVYHREKTTGIISRKTERVESLTLRFDTGGKLKDFEYRYSGD